MRRGLLATALVGLTAWVCWATVRNDWVVLHSRHTPQIKIVALAVVGALAAWAVTRAPRRWAMGLVVAAAIALPAVAFLPTAPFSNDLNRYALDGRVQAGGVDPYRYGPLDPQLDRFHDRWLYPAASDCRALDLPPGCTRVNHYSGHTIYPPVAELFFLGEHAVGVDHLRDRGYELVGFGLSLAILAVLLALLRSEGRDPRLAAWWVLSPFPAVELVANAHVDGLAILLSVLAFWSWRRGQRIWPVVLVALATMVKLYPAVLLLAFLDLRQLRLAVRQVAAFVGVCVVAYLPHVAAVGTAVIGYLPTYLQDEHYDAGTRYLLVGLLGLSGSAATAVVVVAYAAVAGAVLWRRPPPLIGAVWLYGALFLLLTPAQPWYAASLAAVAVAAARPEWLAVGVASYPFYFAPGIDGQPVRDGRIAFGIAAVVVAVTAAVRRYRSPRSGSDANARMPSAKETVGA